MSRCGMPVHVPLTLTRMAALGTAVAAVSALMVGASPIASAQSAEPKAYIGLFGDNAIAVLDTAANTGTKTIPIPTGPHGLVITPDNKWVYVSSDGDSVVSVISTATDEVTTSIEVGTTPHGLAITPDGSRVLVAWSRHRSGRSDRHWHQSGDMDGVSAPTSQPGHHARRTNGVCRQSEGGLRGIGNH